MAAPKQEPRVPAPRARDHESLYEAILLIRLFEERVLRLFDEGKLSGTTHTCIGQEALAVAAARSMDPQDLVFASHRNHGHYLARSDDPCGLLAELAGREGGVCLGRGGSQNICRDGFFSAGVQGGYMPIVAGMALAEKRRGSGRIVTAFIGDGTFGEGALYEALNVASLWKVPLLVVVEDNLYAQTTPSNLNLSGSMRARFEAFGIPAAEIESNDVGPLLSFFSEQYGDVRGGSGPRAAIVHTYRLAAHSKGDDDRPASEIASWRERDPVKLASAGLAAASVERIGREVAARLAGVEKEVWEMAPAPASPAAGAGSFRNGAD
jgi:TPP-dependent pyruvate/acetoin dehydrogenase alpha subunit